MRMAAGLCTPILAPGDRAMTVISTLLLLLAAGAAPAAEGSGQWLQLRGDRHMSGRAAGTGRMTDGPPAEAWRHDIAAWEGYASVIGGAGDSVVPLPFPGDLDAGWFWRERAAWGLGPQLHDLAGDGTLVPMPVHNVFKVAAILPGVAGLQRFEMGDSFSDGGAGAEAGPAPGLRHRRAPRRVGDRALREHLGPERHRRRRRRRRPARPGGDHPLPHPRLRRGHGRDDDAVALPRVPQLRPLRRRRHRR